MNDGLVAELRTAAMDSVLHCEGLAPQTLFWRAADEIERLTKELSNLQSLHAAGSSPYDKKIDRLQAELFSLRNELNKLQDNQLPS